MFLRKNGEKFLYIISSFIATKISSYVHNIYYQVFIFLILFIFLWASIYSFHKNVLMKIELYRRVFDPVYPIEGYWFEVVEETMDHPYSVGRIYRDENGDLCYEGHNYTINYEFNAFWKSNKVAIYPDGTVGFLFDAKIFRGAKEIQGAGSLTFCGEKEKGLYLEGVGVFADYDGECKKYHLKLIRIMDEHLKEIFEYIPENLDENRRVNVIKYFVSLCKPIS